MLSLHLSFNKLIIDFPSYCTSRYINSCKVFHEYRTTQFGIHTKGIYYFIVQVTQNNRFIGLIPLFVYLSF